MAVEAATVVFGQYKPGDGKDGRVCLEQWLKKFCRDYRIRSDNGSYRADMLFCKPVDPVWLTQRTGFCASRWGFEKKTWDHSRVRHLSLGEYLQGATPIISGQVQKLLSKVYNEAVGRVTYLEAFPNKPYKRRRT